MSLLANRQVGYTVAHIATDLRLALIRAMMARAGATTCSSRSGGFPTPSPPRRSAPPRPSSSAPRWRRWCSVPCLPGIAFSISWQAGVAAAVAGGAAAGPAAALIRISRRAGRAPDRTAEVAAHADRRAVRRRQAAEGHGARGPCRCAAHRPDAPAGAGAAPPGDQQGGADGAAGAHAGDHGRASASSSACIVLQMPLAACWSCCSCWPAW